MVTKAIMDHQGQPAVRGANGSLPLNLGWRGGFQKLLIWGGPYDNYPGPWAYGVCVRAEGTKGRQIDTHLPIADFQVPDDEAATKEAVLDAMKASLDGYVVYVGCMGGWGRTGLFMALLAKTAGYSNPVAYVREHYSVRAVETPKQKEFINNFDVSDLRADVRGYAWGRRLHNLWGTSAARAVPRSA